LCGSAWNASSALCWVHRWLGPLFLLLRGPLLGCIIIVVVVVVVVVACAIAITTVILVVVLVVVIVVHKTFL
jgi:hypothetical protein